MSTSPVEGRAARRCGSWGGCGFKHAKAYIYLPADRLPVAGGRAELRRLRALVAIGARDAERGDARVAEGEDDVARRDFAHGLVEGIAGFVSVALG